MRAALVLVAALACNPPPEAPLDSGSDVFLQKEAGVDAAFDAPTEATTCDANTSQSCGTCGHDCLGGACDAGACMPSVIAMGSDVGIAPGPDFYFMAGTGVVASAVAADFVSQPKFPTSEQNVGPSPSGIVTSIAQAPAGASTTVFYGLESGDIASVWWDGSHATTLLSGTELEPDGMTFRSGSLYWTRYYDHLVRSCTTSSCASTLTSIVTLASDDFPTGITHDAQYLYYAHFTAAAGVITRCGFDGSNPADVIAVDTGVWGVTVDGTRLYWGMVTNPGEAIWMCDTSQCNATAHVIAHLADTNPGIIPWSVSVDATSVYFVDHTNNWAYRLAKP